MQRFRRGALFAASMVAVVAGALFFGSWMRAYADYPARDGSGTIQNFASIIFNGSHHPKHVVEGLVGGAGNPQPLNVDVNGNLGTQAPAWASSGVAVVSTTITAARASSSFTPAAGRTFHIQLSGVAVAACVLERSLDGSTWVPITVTAASSTTTMYNWSYAGSALSEDVSESQFGVAYRVDCGATLGSFTSGSLTVRISQ